MADLRRHISLTKGLYTSVDAVDAPLGSLKIGVNAQYFPHTTEFALANGRRYSRGVPPANPQLGYWAKGPIESMFGLSWDIGDPEHTLLYYDVGRSNFKLDELADQFDLPVNQAGSFSIDWPSQSKFDIVSFENEFYIATGQNRKPAWLRREAISGGFSQYRPQIRPWGMEEVVPGPRLATSANLNLLLDVTTGTQNLDGASAWYWFVWVNKSEDETDKRDVEGTSAGFVDMEEQVNGINNLTQGIVEGAFYNTQSVAIHVRREDFTRETPTGATHIRIFRGIGDSPSSTTVEDAPFPIGSQIAEVALTDITTSTYTLPLGAGSKTVNTWLLATDDFTLDKDDVGKIFDFVTIRQDGKATQIGRNGKPPQASTVTVFDESVVSNDVNDKRKTRFSFPGKPHYWPALFYINHESKESDRVITHRVLKNRLGCFLRYGVDRVNWLPRQSAVNFDRDRVKEQLTRSRGLVNKFAITEFQHPQHGELLAYVSDDGIYITDLLRPVQLWTSHVRWTDLVAEPEACILIDEPDMWRLVLVHSLPGDEALQRLTYIYYDTMHLDEQGRPAIIGPVDRSGGIAALQLVRTKSGKRILVSSDLKGNVLYESVGVEEQGTEDTDGGTAIQLSMQVRTPDVYPTGLLTAAQITRMGFRGSGSGVNTGKILIPRKADEYQEVTKALDFTQDPLVTKKFISMPERFAFVVTGTTQARVSHVAVIGDDDVGEVDR